MTTVFLLINQEHLLLEKSGNWGYGNDLRAIYRTPHHDEAINQKVELTVKNPDLRMRIIEAQLDERGIPVLEQEILSQIPPRPPQIVTPEEPQDALENAAGKPEEQSSAQVQMG